jgi:hypothetical protein
VKREHGSQAWLAVALAVSLGACTPPPGPPPVTQLGDNPCASAPDLATARPVFLSSDKPVTVDLDATVSCLSLPEGKRGVYVAFALPESPKPYMVTISSTPQGETLFSPRALVLDASGATVQELPRGAFMFHGATLSVAFRTHGSERFVVVTSDPDSVGQQQSQLQSGTQTTTAASGPVILTVRTGWEKNNNYTYALNGRITVSAQPVPSAY